MAPTTTQTLEQTLAIIKPDAVGQNMIGNILEYYEREGLSVIAAKMLHLTQDQAKSFYSIHKERPFFKELIDFMTSGPVLVLVLEGRTRSPATVRLWVLPIHPKLRWHHPRRLCDLHRAERDPWI